jgi:hypothetical protein
MTSFHTNVDARPCTFTQIPFRDRERRTGRTARHLRCGGLDQQAPTSGSPRGRLSSRRARLSSSREPAFDELEQCRHPRGLGCPAHP